MRYRAALIVPGLLICSAAVAAEPATRQRDRAPADRPAERLIGQVIDPSVPRAVPEFLAVGQRVVGAEGRDWARTNTWPAPLPWYAVDGWGFGRSCGWGYRPSHVFFR